MPTPLPRAKEGGPEAAISPKARALIGVLTTLFFTTIGVSFLMSQRYGAGSVFLLLAIVRASVAVRQLVNAFGSGTPGDDSKD